MSDELVKLTPEQQRAWADWDPGFELKEPLTPNQCVFFRAAFFGGWDARAALEAVGSDAERMLLPIVSTLNNIVEEIEDEGDRSYFGSTNDADRLKEIAATLDQWRFDRAALEQVK